MTNYIKKEMESEFSRNDNYQKILFDISHRSFSYRYIIVIMSLIVLSISCLYLLNRSSNHNVNSSIKTSQNLDTIYINKYVSEIEVDIDGKWIDENIGNLFPFIKNLEIPQDIDQLRQGKIYIRENENDDLYSKFQEYYLFYYKNEDDSSYIEFNFSKNELLEDCIIYNYENNKIRISTISTIPVTIFESNRDNDSKMMYGKALFKCQEYDISIKCHKISHEQFIQFIQSVIKGFNNNEE